jgi:hypothetical protein
VLEIARARVPKAPPSRDSLKAAYGSLLQAERCRHRSDDGCNAGPDADNLINIGRFVAAQPAT